MKNLTIVSLLIFAAARFPAFAINEEAGPKGLPSGAIGAPITGIKPIGEELRIAAPDKIIATDASGAIRQTATAPQAAKLEEAVPTLPAPIETNPQSAAGSPAGFITVRIDEPSNAATPAEMAAAAEESPKDKPSMAALKREVRELARQRDTALAGAMTIGVRFKDAPSVTALESVGRLHESAAAINSKIDAKKGEIAKLRQADRVRYDELKSELDDLKFLRGNWVAAAKSAETVGREYKGGAEEARGRALSTVQDLDGEIAAVKQKMGLIERDNPSFAGLRAPVVVAMDLLGVGPMTAKERALRDEIKGLHRRSFLLRARAANIMVGQRHSPSLDAVRSADDMSGQAADIDIQVQAKKKELAALR